MSTSGPDASGSENRESKARASYVNHLTISFDLSEFQIDFGQASNSGQPPQIIDRLITSPANFDRFKRQFCDSMRRYERDFGSSSNSDDRRPGYGGAGH